jgi:arylsulfatase A-like enzyme
VKHKIYLSGSLILLLILFFSPPLDAKPDLKNIIIISVDTLRADHLACFGYPLETSPNIDALARDGIRFSNCCALTPLTSPSFSTMLTSLPPHKHGSKRNGLPVYRKIKTLPYFLKRFGYRSTAIISNWPLRKKLAELHQYFDVYYEVFTKKRWMGVLNNEGEAPDVTQMAVDWLERNHKKRFFLWVQYTEPHMPYVLHEGFTFDYQKVPASVYPPGTKMKRIKKYDSEIAFVDFYIGKLIKKIKELGLYEEALIVFNSDHGESFGEHDYFRHGRKLYNSTLHVPLVFKLPHNRLKNTVRQENVSIIDIGPAIFSALDLPVYSGMEGVALFDEKNDAVENNRKILLETYGGTVHFRRNAKKYHLKIKPIRCGVLQGPIKVIYNIKDKSVEVYHQRDDRFETKNIFLEKDRDPGLKEMKQALMNKVNSVLEYIKLLRARRAGNTTISKEDLERLESLGYIYEKD